MANLNTMTFSKVNSELQALTLGEHKLTDILKIIMSCQTFTPSQLASFKLAPGTGKTSDSESKADLNEMWVDFGYQRKMTLPTILNNLESQEGFNNQSSGHIDVTIRPNGKTYVWDGFRRAIMALMCGEKELAASTYIHPSDRPSDSCSEFEAGLFLYRNAWNEKMGANEIFVGKVCKKYPKSLLMQKVLERANININGLYKGGKNTKSVAYLEVALGYNEVRGDTEVVKKIEDNDFIDSSLAIQTAWDESSIGAYMICGLANVISILRKNPEEVTTYEIYQKLVDYAKTNKELTLTKPRIASKATQSVTFAILTKVLKRNIPDSRKLAGLNDEEAKKMKLVGLNLMQDEDMYLNLKGA